METTNFDKTIKQKFDNRTITPSSSAWERLETQLDAQPKSSQRNWIFYLSVAASILLLITIGVKLFSTETEIILPKEEYVVSPQEQEKIKNKIKEALQQQVTETEIVSNNPKTVQEQKEKEEIFNSKIKSNAVKKEQELLLNSNKHIAKVDDEKTRSSNNNKVAQVQKNEQQQINQNNTTPLKEITIKKLESKKSKITIKPEDLLYAVTHTSEEVKAYYSKYNIDRNDVLKSIKYELKKSKIKMNPESMLAEVEQSIMEDDFQNNFLKVVKERVTLLASAIANRNN